MSETLYMTDILRRAGLLDRLGPNCTMQTLSGKSEVDYGKNSFNVLPLFTMAKAVGYAVAPGAALMAYETPQGLHFVRFTVAGAGRTPDPAAWDTDGLPAMDMDGALLIRFICGDAFLQAVKEDPQAWFDQGLFDAVAARSTEARVQFKAKHGLNMSFRGGVEHMAARDVAVDCVAGSDPIMEGGNCVGHTFHLSMSPDYPWLTPRDNSMGCLKKDAHLDMSVARLFMGGSTVFVNTWWRDWFNRNSDGLGQAKMGYDTANVGWFAGEVFRLAHTGTRKLVMAAPEGDGHDNWLMTALFKNGTCFHYDFHIRNGAMLNGLLSGSEPGLLDRVDYNKMIWYTENPKDRKCVMDNIAVGRVVNKL